MGCQLPYGRLAWKQGINIEPIRLDRYRISCLVYSDPSFCPWLLTCTNGPHSWYNRATYWDNLTSVGNSFVGPWLIVGDFNSILNPGEKRGGGDFGSTSHNEFVSFVNHNGLVDLGFNGNAFTWDNRRHGRANIKERLDRGLTNQDWVHIFPNAFIKHLPAAASNHNPILLSTGSNYFHSPKPFQFEAFWVRDLSSHIVVAIAWISFEDGSPAFTLCLKWKNTKRALNQWNHTHFGKIQSRIINILSDLDKIQQAPNSTANSAKELELQDNLQEQLAIEEILWKQKSREQWLCCHDLNTNFFHASTVNRMRYNSVSFLKTAESNILKTSVEIGSYFVDYFSSIFTSTNPILDVDLDELVSPVITDLDNLMLCKIPEEREIY